MLGYQVVKGFTLVEVLVATVIMAIGLLGLAAMQTIALKDNQDAFFYTQASSLAYEMSDRIKANAVAWQDAASIPADTPCDKSCDFAAPCSADEMATFDYCAWQSNVRSRIAGATATVAASPVLDPLSTVCTDNTGSRLCLTISWDRNHQQVDDPTIAQNNFQLEIQP
ncbi:type IV pilus modification protein PilV [Crenothrix sp.]|uniref:type IV pilus modification protein PilV n=1 Tax=Crenothrix sp. TaxID=3100433 RepID=UPI00374DEE52